MIIRYHWKRSIARLLVIMMVLTLFTVALTVNAVSAEVGDTIYYEGFETDNTLQQNGDATITLANDLSVEGSGSLKVTPTADNNYSGVAIRNDSLDTPMLPGGKYKLTAKAYSAKDAKLGVRVETRDSSGGDTYGSVGSVKPTLTAGQWVDIALDFDVPEDHKSVTSIVFHNDDSIPGLTFYLDEVMLQITALPAPVEEKEITKLLSFTFDDKAVQDSLFTVAVASEIEWAGSPGVGKSDDNALKVTHIDGRSYTSADNAVRLTLAEPLPAGGVYNVSVWFYAPVAGNEGKDTLTGPGVVINNQYALNEFKLPSNFGTLPVGEWKQVNINTPFMETPLNTIDFRLVVNDKERHADVWFIDDIEISQVGELEEVIVPEWDLKLSSIADIYKDSFLIGNIMNSNQTTDAENTAMYKHHYSVVTAENDMKPQYLSSAKGVYNYTNADTIVGWAQDNGIKVHGHTLVWHSQSARWLTSDAEGKAVTRAEAKSNMEEYISNVAGHFKGKVYSWDVVNEAFDGGSIIPEDWKTVLRKDSPWYIAYENGADASKGESGADYIYDAFVFARQADNEAILYYNDYNENDPWKREAMALMAEELNEKWKTDQRNTQPDRLLVEGLGMQSHYWTDNLDVDTVDAAIARFVKAGVKISITELDIPYGSYSNQHSAPLTKDEEIAQAKLYAQLFNTYNKYAQNIERITFWGKADPQSWRAKGSPLLFNKAYAAKESYFAVVDPEGYLLSSWKNPYNDVAASDWFYKYVAYASEKGLIYGTGAAAFSPTSDVTWSQFLAMLYRLDGQTGETRGKRWNLASDSWAKDNGIADSFSSDQPLSRQDMAVIVEKYLSYSGKTLPASDEKHTYADDASIAEEAKPAVNLLYDAGVMTGKSNNMFDPTGYTNRAEMAGVLYRLAEAI